MQVLRAAAGAAGLGFVALLFSCAPENNIAPQYARYTGCPQSKVEIDRNGPGGLPRASGCGNNLTFRCRLDGDCKSPVIVVAERHAKQFSCTPQEANVEDLGNDAYVARGCGQVLTYQCFRDGQHIVRCIVETSERKAESGD